MYSLVGLNIILIRNPCFLTELSAIKLISILGFFDITLEIFVIPEITSSEPVIVNTKSSPEVLISPRSIPELAIVTLSYLASVSKSRMSMTMKLVSDVLNISHVHFKSFR